LFVERESSPEVVNVHVDVSELEEQRPRLIILDLLSEVVADSEHTFGVVEASVGVDIMVSGCLLLETETKAAGKLTLPRLP
jgi:hypothetical protein